MHPLVTDLTPLSDKELADKIMDLERKYAAAARMGSPAAQQIVMFLEDYKFEHQRRLQEQMEKVLKQNGKTFDSIIDIK